MNLLLKAATKQALFREAKKMVIQEEFWPHNWKFIKLLIKQLFKH